MTKRRAFVSLLVAGAARSFGQDWPQWRGPNRDGVAATQGAPPSWPESLRQVWKTAVGEGHSSPVIGDGRVYEFARIGEREVASAYDLASGRKLWESATEAPYRVPSVASAHGAGPKSTPLLAGGRLYTFGISGILSCLDAATGKTVWRYDGREWKRPFPGFGVAMSPVLLDGAVIAHVGGDYQGALTAFDAATGRIRWQWKGDGPGYSSPVLMKGSLVTFSVEKLIAVDARTGELQWELPFTTPYSQNAVTPLPVSGDVLVYSGLSHPLTAIRITGKSVQKVWENRDAGMYMSSPVVAAGMIHGLTNRNKGQFVSVDPATGRTVWSGDGRQGENAALVVQGSTVFALTTEAELHVFRASPRGLESIRRYTVANSPTWAHPAVIGARVVVKDQDSLALWTV